MKKWEEDQIASEPTTKTEHARAWRLDLDAIPNRNASVVCWLVEAPWAHPIWHSYRISLVHLREIAGLPPAVIRLPGATHEVVVQALDPDSPRERLLIAGECHPLFPLNFAAQMIAESDEAAAMEVAYAVNRICEGTLSPDTDFMQQWIGLFGDNMIKDGDKDRLH